MGKAGDSPVKPANDEVAKPANDEEAEPANDEEAEPANDGEVPLVDDGVAGSADDGDAGAGESPAWYSFRYSSCLRCSAASVASRSDISRPASTAQAEASGA